MAVTGGDHSDADGAYMLGLYRQKDGVLTSQKSIDNSLLLICTWWPFLNPDDFSLIFANDRSDTLA